MNKKYIFLLLIIILLFPSRYKISTQAIAIPKQQECISTSIPGTIQEIYTTPGSFVTKNTPLLKLKNTYINSLWICKQIDFQKTKLLIGQTYIGGSLNDKNKLPFLFDTLNINSIELDKISLKIDRLILKSPINGYITTPSLKRKIGAFIPSHTSILNIADTSQLKLLIPIQEEDMKLINNNSKIKIRWVGSGSTFFSNISLLPQKKTPPENYAPAFLATFGGPAPIEIHHNHTFPIYIAEANLENNNHFFINGMRLHVTVYGKWTFLGNKIIRNLLYLTKLNLFI